jgi:hypothetical protein
MQKFLFLLFGLVLVNCNTIDDKSETKIGRSIQPNEFESDIQEKQEVDKPTIHENKSTDLEEIIKEKKMDNNNKNSADLWKESLLSYMDLHKSPRRPCSGDCTRNIQCVFRAGNVNCRCSSFSCVLVSL